MLGNWADDESDDEFSHFSGLGGSKSKSKGGKSGGGSADGSFMFVSSGVFDLASGKKESEDKVESAAMQVDDSAHTAPAKPKKPKATPKEAELGRWEQFTNGAGSRMLKKMGWKGSGLGVNENGLVQPLQSVVRGSGTGGLDADDYMGISRAAARPQDAAEEPETIETKVEERKGQWKKDAPKAAPSKPKAPKVTYKTREEYESQYGGPAAQTIVDMRAPSGDDASSLRVAALESQPTFMPELRHNLAHLVDLRVNGIHSLIRKKHYAETELKTLKSEEASLKHIVEGQQSDISHFKILKNRLNVLRESEDDPDFDLHGFFAELKDTFPEEYKRYRLESLIFHHVFPRIEKELKTWKPLQEPEYGLEKALKWRQLLREEAREALDNLEPGADVYDDGFGISSRLRKEQVKTSLNSLDTYNRMAYEVYVPKLRSALSSWDVYNPDPALDLLGAWKLVLPRIGYNFLLYHVVQNRLKSAVAEYEPAASKSSKSSSKPSTTSSNARLPLDTWVLPWIPVMGTSQISTLLEDVRRKLSQSVASVSASVGVKLLLPFKGVLDAQNWAQLQARSVLAKIETLLRQVEIDPSEQRLESWQEALEWSALVSPEAFGMALLESGFWKKWFGILGLWLHQPDVDFEQVQQWYTSWKQHFPKPIQTSTHVQPQFRAALRLMLAASEGDIPPTEQFVPVKIDPSAKHVQAGDDNGDGNGHAKKTSTSSRPVWQEASLKELLEEAAEEAGTLFMATNRKQEGNPVFTFGNVPVFLDRDLVVAQLHPGAAWQPISIVQLISHASNSM